MARRQPILPKKVSFSPRKMLDRIALEGPDGLEKAGEVIAEADAPNDYGKSSEGRNLRPSGVRRENTIAWRRNRHTRRAS